MDCSAVKTTKPPFHTSHNCKVPQQNPLHVDTSIEAFFLSLVVFCPLIGEINNSIFFWFESVYQKFMYLFVHLIEKVGKRLVLL